jgi:mono/diheme cytochrome c family protein
MFLRMTKPLARICTALVVTFAFAVLPLHAQDRDLQRRGNYLVSIGACASCHATYDAARKTYSRSLGGGATIASVRIPNITPDEKTGIGAWTPPEVAVALRSELRNPAAAQPRFAVHGFPGLSSRDALAIHTYLQSLEAVSNAASPTSAKPAANLDRDVPEPDRSNIVATGFYFAQAAGCLRCHSPLSEGSIDLSKAGKGGTAYSARDDAVIAAPDISAGSSGRIGAWSDRDIKIAITRGRRPDGSRLSPVMPFDAFDQIREPDLDSIIAYLRSLK